MKIKKSALLFLFLLFSFTGFSQYDAVPDSLSKLAYQEIIALKFVHAEKILSLEKQQFPMNLYADYLENYIDFLTVFIREEDDLLDSLEENKSVRLNKMELLPDSNRYKRLMMANINLQWAFARMKFKEFFTASLEINRAYRLMSENENQFPRFVPDDIAMGVLHVMIGLVPDEYHWILSLISMKGSVEQGKAELYSVLKQGLSNPQWASLTPEALFYLVFIELNLSPDRTALNHLVPYLQKYGKGNLLMDYLKITIFMHTGQNDSALRILESIEGRKGYLPFYYLDYLHGECLIRKLNPEADQYYDYYLEHFKGENYRKDAWRKKALLAALNGSATEYALLMDSVLTHGNTLVDADIDAEQEAKREDIPPDKGLLEARFLFDGGYYHKALDRLDAMDTSYFAPDQKLEFLYRYGRIYHCLHQLKKAQQFYLETIRQRGESTRYFAANAALKTGQIYESEGAWKQAAKYYNLCLDMDFDEYRNSILAKAKDGLERIEKREK